LEPRGVAAVGLLDVGARLEEAIEGERVLEQRLARNAAERGDVAVDQDRVGELRRLGGDVDAGERAALEAGVTIGRRDATSDRATYIL
jgi:hypothetical protein